MAVQLLPSVLVITKPLSPTIVNFVPFVVIALGVDVDGDATVVQSTPSVDVKILLVAAMAT
jgi:hypothetical protein